MSNILSRFIGWLGFNAPDAIPAPERNIDGAVRGTDLSSANLSGANPGSILDWVHYQPEVVEERAIDVFDAERLFLQKRGMVNPVLGGADLSDFNLSAVDTSTASVEIPLGEGMAAVLQAAIDREADLARANLRYSELLGANLRYK